MNILQRLPLALPTEGIMSSKVSMSWVSLRNTEQQNPFNFTLGGCSAQGYAFKCLGCTHSISLLSQAVFILQAKVPFCN
jgi:hypothetical protein